MGETPSTAFILSLIGGIFVVIGGLGVIAFGLFMGAVGSAFTAFMGGIGGFAGVPIIAFGALGLLWGILIIGCAALLQSKPENHQLFGALILVFSVLSWVGAFGGLVIGFVLALVGGILAIIWKPGAASVNVMSSSAPGYATAAPGAPSGSGRFCPNCGAATDGGSRFCRNCGKAL